ncbi:S-adenosyl-L-methionine-dependent methyltransferase, partial [Infundibulicybe gibba]
FTRLIAALGPRQARIELRWLRQAQADIPLLTQLISRRADGEPLQYILGTQPFGPLNLLTRPPVLIPRPETEHWTHALADLISPSAQSPVTLLDLGTGSACIPLLLAHLWPPAVPPFHVLTSNPPYIPSSHAHTLPRSVRDYEDHSALFAGPTGLEFYHTISRLTRRPGFLAPGAVVALECSASFLTSVLPISGPIPGVFRAPSSRTSDPRLS